MPRFLVTYYAGDMASDPASIADARRAFMRWAEQAGPVLADAGTPVRGTLTIGAEGVLDRIPGEPLLGWSVLDAADRDAALQLVQHHPFLSLGGTLQISDPV
ncbi:MAG TPA: hypothetical protein VKB62_07940 [Streptosporangiaceae bacterium]|nr:hypothetical protein [Streptosporangiaceae bacterium]